MARQSELWHKYKFICSCRRCAALSPQYVDNALQETFSINLHSETTSLNSRNEGVEKLRDYIESVTSAFMSTGNSVICCTKIENLLSFGLISGGSESKEGSSVSDFRLSPIHQLSLNAYTTLSSAHGIRAVTLINENKVEAYKATRISAGYSLLRAGSVNHLFLSEPSLIVSAATFWTSAGESLLSLARSSVWDSSTNWLAGNPTANCDDCCCLVDTFEVCSCCPGAQEEEFAKRCHDMLKCISGITSKSIVWIFLAQGCHFLRGIEDPINFDWLGSLRDFNVWQYHSEVTDSKLCSSNRNEFGFVKGSDDDDDIRMSVFQLGAHCLVFGGFLSVVCYGPDSCRIDYMKNLLRSS